MKKLAVFALLAPMAVTMSSMAFAESTVVIKDRSPGNSAFGHEQWRNGRGHRDVVIKHRTDDIQTGTVVKKKVIHRTDGMGGHSKTVIKKTTTED